MDQLEIDNLNSVDSWTMMGRSKSMKEPLRIRHIKVNITVRAHQNLRDG